MTVTEKEVFTKFLVEINEIENWLELILHVEIQPGMLGFKGWVLCENGKKISLRTRPTNELKEFVKELHAQVAISVQTKWNKLEFVLLRNMNFKRMFIWDDDWQQNIDKENQKHKQKNQEYNLPKWQWEDAKPTA